MSDTDFFIENSLTPRESQRRVLKTVQENWHKFKYFICSAPTGVGKTYIACAIAHSLNNSYIITSTLQLQKQYEDSWDAIVNLKGRSNYTCALNSAFRVDNAPCNIKRELAQNCKKECRCPYYNQKNLALRSKAMITNPVYLLYSSHCGFAKEESEWTRRDALIIDEAHNTEKHLVAFGESELDIDRLQKSFDVNLSGLHFTGDLSSDYKTIALLKAKLADRAAELDKKRSAIMLADNRPSEDLDKWASTFSAVSASKTDDLNKKINALDRAIQPINVFFSTHTGVEDVRHRWMIWKDPKKNAVKISPLKASFLFHSYYGGLAEKFVFLSATPGSKEEFCSELGIPLDECLYVEEPSPFDPELSPVVILPSIRLSKDVYDENIKKVGKIVEEILKEHSGKRGIIHSTTYDIQQKIYDGVRASTRPRLTCRDMDILSQGLQARKYSNEDLLEIHASKKDSVLVSPSMMEGVDLFDDLSEFQIIIKLPWANLGDPRTKIKSELEPSWYSNEMWLKLIQAAGRSTRHDKDASVTYILDSNFKFFWKKWQHKLPIWFNDRLCEIST